MSQTLPTSSSPFGTAAELAALIAKAEAERSRRETQERNRMPLNGQRH